MKRLKTYLLSIFTVGAFSMLMMFNVNTTDEGFEINLCGETVLANDGECKEVDGSVTPRFLNFNIFNPGWEKNCTYVGNGCIPCTSTPIQE